MKNNKFLMGVIRAPFDDGGAAAFGASAVDVDSVDDDGDYNDGSDNGQPYDAGDAEPAQFQQQPRQAHEPQLPLSAVMQLIQQQQPQQPQQPQRQLTQEEIDKQLKVFRPNAEHVRRLFSADSPEEQVAVLNEMFSAQAEHFSTLMGYALNNFHQQLSQQYSPALEMVEEQRMGRFIGGIVHQFPALKGYDQTVRQVIAMLKASGYQPASGEEAARTIAGQVESLIRSANPQFTLQGQRPQGQQTAMPTMAPLSGGAGGRASGGGGSNGSGGKKPSWAGVFD